jgi:hypothetical protein
LEFAYWRDQTGLALRQLDGSGALTGPGQVVVAALGETLARWRAEALPAEVEARVRKRTAATLAAWRRDNPQVGVDDPPLSPERRSG